MLRCASGWWGGLCPVLVWLGLAVVVGAVLALALRMARGVMSPTSENTSILFLALLAAGAAMAAHFGGSAPLAAALGFVLSRPEIDIGLVGVTSLGELEAILTAMAKSLPDLDWAACALSDEQILTPTLWPEL